MCGIAGILSKAPDADDLRVVAESMAGTLVHRGPDDRGIYTEPNAALAHTRLSILDLSEKSHQPMVSDSGRYVIVFNGEIYNFRELRAELEDRGEQFKSTGDTEVLLKLFQREGENCLTRLQGMFAFVIWDTESKSAFLARDPLGIKPLYYNGTGDRLLFASEIRTLVPHLEQISLDVEGLNGFLLYGNVPEPSTLLSGVSLLPAGTWIRWTDGRTTAPRAYWSLKDVFARQCSDDHVASIRDGLMDSVQRHLVSDVPVGIFLSGGIDSTCILALASKQSKNEIQTFSIGFEEEEWNEAPVAARIAKHFASRHTEHVMMPQEGLEAFTSYIHAVDQPSIDGLNTWCVARMASQHGMKVVMSGLGGDELFCGYPSFRHPPRMAQIYRLMPQFARRGVGGILERSNRDARMRRLGDFFRSQGGIAEAWRTFRGLFTREEACRLLRNGFQLEAPSDINIREPVGTAKDQITQLEILMYMRNQLLRDSDVMSMAHGLELRVPFVDSRFAEIVLSVPSHLRARPGKALLLDAVPEIPRFVANAPKRGFRFPFAEWIGRDWYQVFDPVQERYSQIVPLDSWSRLFALYVLDSWRESIGMKAS